jgi:RNA polymerase sigma-70 factor (ECF subfamily)
MANDKPNNPAATPDAPPRSTKKRDTRSRNQSSAADAAVDRDLMARVAAGEPDATGELYDRFGSLIYRMALQALPTRPEAEDAVQEVFVRLWRTADRYDSSRAALVTWVMLITRRHLVDKLRRTRSRISAVSMDAHDGLPPRSESPGQTPMEQQERLGGLLKKVDTLPELQRTVVVRAYLGGQTLRQISEELSTPLGTIKSALSRALIRLRESVGEDAIE